MKWYLAGPMSYIPQFNFPFFDKVATALRGQGLEIVSPAELDEPEVREAALASPDGKPNERTSGGKTWGDFLSRDLKLVADSVDGVILMRGWLESKGARQEAFTALQCGKQFAYLNEGIGPTFSVEKMTAGDVSYRLRRYLQTTFEPGSTL